MATLGRHDIFARLIQEHREATALLERLKQSEDPALRRSLFPEVRDKLLAHEEGELMELYTLLRRDERTRALAEEHDVAAGELRVVVDALAALETSDPAWPSALAQLTDALSRHVDAEENDYFAKASLVLSPAETAQLAANYASTRQRVLERFEQLHAVTAAT